MPVSHELTYWWDGIRASITPVVNFLKVKVLSIYIYSIYVTVKFPTDIASFATYALFPGLIKTLTFCDFFLLGECALEREILLTIFFAPLRRPVDSTRWGAYSAPQTPSWSSRHLRFLQHSHNQHFTRSASIVSPSSN